MHGDHAAHAPAASSSLAHSASSKPHHHHRRLLRYEEIEAWRQDNHWIHTGYRVSDARVASCVDSLFFLHNESGNVYSHLGGAVAFVGFAAWTFAEIEMKDWFDR